MRKRTPPLIPHPRIVQLLLMLAALVGLSFTLAQVIDPTRPDEWLVSPAAVIAAGTYLASQIVRLLTAVGKDWFHTDGNSTRILALVISGVIAGVGGYLSLGYFSDMHGLKGAFSAAVMVILSSLGAMAQSEYDRQAAAAGALRAELKAKLPRP